MSNPLANWLRSLQFNKALQKGNIAQAQQVLDEIQLSGVRLSLLQRVFKDKLQSEQRFKEYEREVIVLREQITSVSKTSEERQRDIEKLLSQLEDKNQENALAQLQLETLRQQNKLSQTPRSLFDDYLLYPNQDFVKSVEKQFCLNELKANLIQCTSINKELFLGASQMCKNIPTTL